MGDASKRRPATRRATPLLPLAEGVLVGFGLAAPLRARRRACSRLALATPWLWDRVLVGSETRAGE